ncbi:MAG TPA: response regulator [Thermodesulfobacteriota bacterium]|nr:response regulator [Thermodesulfobacteriota bacterium]
MSTEKVLVVEDEENLAQYIKFTLNNLGYDVPAVVSSGEDAIQKTGELKPDLVLMDIVLKGEMDGIEAAERIRTIFDIPVIYLTGYTDTKTLKRANIEEPFGYLLKPFQKRELHTAIETAIYKHRMVRKLNESQMQLASMLEILEDGVIVSDKGGYITLVNAVAASMIGGNKKDIIGKNLGEIFQFRDQMGRDIGDGYLTSLVDDNEANGGKLNHAVLTRSDGLEKEMRYRALSTKDEKGDVTGFFIVLPKFAESNHSSDELFREHEELKRRLQELSAELEEAKDALQLEMNERIRAEEVFRQHFAELSRKNKYQTLISAITHSIHKSVKVEKVLESTVEVISNSLDNADYVAIFLVEGQDAVLKAHKGYPDSSLERMSRITYPKDTTWKTIIEGKALYLADLEQEMFSNTERKELEAKSLISLPISSRGTVIGCINVHSTRENAFNGEELKLLEAISKQLEIAIDDAEWAEALRQSEERYRMSFNQSPIGLLLFDKEFKITHCNERLSEIIHYPQEKIIGLDMRNLEGLSSPPEMNRIFEGESSRFEAIFEANTASKLWLSMSLSPLRGNDGEIMGGLAVVEDITNRKVIEDAFSQEKERLSVILQSIADGLIVTDTRGKIVIMNKVAEEITGWNKEEALNKSVEGIFLIINKRTRKLSENPVDKTIKTGWTGGLNKDTVLITRNKEEKFVSASSSPIRDKEGKIIGVVLVFRDITERKKIDEELLKNQKIESLSTLAEGIAHDFNNILTGILGNVSLAKMYVNPSDKIYKRLTEAERSCFKAAHLTKQLITFSTGGTSTRKVTSVKELLKVSTSFALRGSNVKTEFYLPEDLWSAEIDERQISQVIYNLVINAQQAMDDGGIIKVTAENFTMVSGSELPVREGRYVKITIEDEGVGISEENLSRVFDPYFTTKHKGSGLGLATAYSIVRNHDGYIGVESKLGAGTKVYVYLPATEEAIPLEEEIIPEGSTEKAPYGNKAKILVMDDDEIIRKVAAEIISHIGYEVELAKEGGEAVELYRKAKEMNEPFDLVILDLTVPGGMGGRETINRLLDLDPGIKAIVSSGYSNDPVISDFQKYGFMGVVNKPYSIEELGKKIRGVIGREDYITN